MDIMLDVKKRAEWIKDILTATGAKGIIYGNSGGKDCTLVGALCRMATENVLGVIMPCQSSVNYGSDREDALAAGEPVRHKADRGGSHRREREPGLGARGGARSGRRR